jgi:hypothetical protein
VGFSANKSEVLRAGLAALNEMSDRELAEVVGSLTRVKTGRPLRKRRLNPLHLVGETALHTIDGSWLSVLYPFPEPGPPCQGSDCSPFPR